MTHFTLPFIPPPPITAKEQESASRDGADMEAIENGDGFQRKEDEQDSDCDIEKLGKNGRTHEQQVVGRAKARHRSSKSLEIDVSPASTEANEEGD